jgi:hypothetical protein
MLMVTDTGFLRSTSTEVEVEPVAEGVGRMVCLECRGDEERYRSYFPPGAVTHCVACKWQGWVYVSI